ncbi:hypothetical protein [Legionella sp. W05-934-2]|jgi:hypothetical protein|uniref:hypothetical protein n=1 Tax=Legionella sp. W05-934-2 TaxID=1198649 RepID=UPI003462BBF4
MLKRLIKNNLFALAILYWLSLFFNTAVAGSLGESIPSERGRIFVLAAVGGGLVNINKTADVFLSDTISNRYRLHRATNGFMMAGFGVGRHIHSINNHPFDLGVSGYYYDLGTFKGRVHPAYNVAPDFDTLNFSLKASSIALLAELRYYFQAQRFQPFLSVAAGAARNALIRYKEFPPYNNLSPAPMLRPFKNHHTINVSSGIGAGVKRQLSRYAEGALEYRFVYLGNAELGVSPIQLTQHRMQFRHLYVNSLILSLFVD